MKKIYLLSICMLLAINFSFSQNSIPNSGFENWVDDNHPNSWYGLSLDVMLTQVHTLSKSDDSFVGSFSAKIESKDALLFVLPGIASLSPISFDLLAGLTFENAGAPIGVKPTKITGNLKYEATLDTAAIIATFTKWNTLQNKRDTLGAYYFSRNTATTSYIPFSININLSQTPDSMNILLIASAGYDNKVGSALYVDNLNLEYQSSAGVENLQLIGGNAYPNPVIDEVMFSIPNQGKSIVKIYDISGKIVYINHFEDNVFSVNVSSLSNGIYQTIIEQNNEFYYHKIQIIK